MQCIQSSRGYHLFSEKEQYPHGSELLVVKIDYFSFPTKKRKNKKDKRLLNVLFSHLNWADSSLLWRDSQPQRNFISRESITFGNLNAFSTLFYTIMNLNHILKFKDIQAIPRYIIIIPKSHNSDKQVPGNTHITNLPTYISFWSCCCNFLGIECILYIAEFFRTSKMYL